MVSPNHERLGSAVVSAILVLWDIDHTLIENHGVNKEAYALAFRLLTGRETEHRARTDGRTEPEIVRDMLALHGITPTADHVARMPQALESATLANRAALRERGHELPGARDALMAFQVSAGVVQSVLSGNIRPNAVTKLSAFGLERFIDFEVGGYGSDDEVRANLVAVAQARATAKYGETFDKANTILVGDTPRDVQAGREGGARVVAVATGADNVESLRAAGADIVLPDLRDTGAVVEAVTSLAG
jgi:phosphoglycolate phosphatase-like HAD superfamily hydrolase